MQGDVKKYLGSSRTRSTVMTASSVAYVAVIFSMMLPQSTAILVAGSLWTLTVIWWGASYAYWCRKVERAALEELGHQRAVVAGGGQGDRLMHRVHDEVRVDVSQGRTLKFDANVLDPYQGAVEAFKRGEGHNRRPRCIRCHKRWTAPQNVDARKTPCYACVAEAPHPLEIPVMKEERGATPGGAHGEEKNKRHDRLSDRRSDFQNGKRPRP